MLRYPLFESSPVYSVLYLYNKPRYANMQIQVEKNHCKCWGEKTGLPASPPPLTQPLSVIIKWRKPKLLV
jgi:hypothetical protein